MSKWSTNIQIQSNWKIHIKNKAGRSKWEWKNTVKHGSPYRCIHATSDKTLFLLIKLLITKAGLMTRTKYFRGIHLQYSRTYPVADISLLHLTCCYYLSSYFNHSSRYLPKPNTDDFPAWSSSPRHKNRINGSRFPSRIKFPIMPPKGILLFCLLENRSQSNHLKSLWVIVTCS